MGTEKYEKRFSLSDIVWNGEIVTYLALNIPVVTASAVLTY
jgi:hypothetical protein